MGERELDDLDRAWNERTKAIERFSQAFADVSVEDVESEVQRIIERTRHRAPEAERRSASLPSAKGE